MRRIITPGRKVESFSVDLYHYPPTFLLLPCHAAIAGGEFPPCANSGFGERAHIHAGDRTDRHYGWSRPADSA